MDKIIATDPTIPELPFKDVNFRIYRDIRFSNDPTPYKVPFPPFSTNLNSSPLNPQNKVLTLPS